MIDKQTIRAIKTAADEAAASEGCYFDPAAADRVCEFFRRFLRHSSGEWAGKPFELLDWQRDDLIRPLYGWKLPDGRRRFRQAYVEIPKKNGKALAVTTPVPTPTGWSTIGELKPGDIVFAASGKPTKVIAVTDTQHNRPCYRMVFSNGAEIVADAEHEWLTSARQTLGTQGDRTSGRSPCEQPKKSPGV